MWEAIKGGLQPQPCHHGIISTQLQKYDPALAVLWCKGALICLGTSLKGANTFYLCQLWMWEAIKGGL